MDSSDGGSVDSTLLDLFRAELDAHIPVLNDGLLALEKGPVSEQEIAAMMRAAHSIKGAARIVGIDAAVRLAHALEDCFTAAKEKHVALSGSAIDTLLQGVDALQRICVPQPDGEPIEAGLDTLLEQIAAVRDGRSPTSSAAPLVAPTQQPTEPLASGEHRLILPADLDDATTARLHLELYEVLRSGKLRICLDFTHVERVSASAIALFESLARAIAGRSPAPKLAADGIAGPVAALMRISGLDRVWSAGG